MTSEWPPGVLARYLTVGGAMVDVSERPGYGNCTELTETYAACTGCTDTYLVAWDFNIVAHEVGRPQDATFDKGGRRSTPRVREWAQSHAEQCRAMPRP